MEKNYNRLLSQKRELHANSATLTLGLFNAKGSLVITGNGLSFRVSPQHPYYAALKELLNDIAHDHVAKKLLIDVALDGNSLTDEILQSL